MTITVKEAIEMERERCANIVRKEMPFGCKCAYLKTYGAKCDRCRIIDQIERKGTATRG